MFASVNCWKVSGRSLAVFARNNEQIEDKLFYTFTSSHKWEEDIETYLKWNGRTWTELILLRVGASVRLL